MCKNVTGISTLSEMKQKILAREVKPIVIGAILTVHHMGPVSCELRDVEGKIKQQYVHLSGIRLWDVSYTAVRFAGDVDFTAVPPRALFAYLDEAKQILYVVEAEYPAPP